MLAMFTLSSSTQFLNDKVTDPVMSLIPSNEEGFGRVPAQIMNVMDEKHLA